MCFQIVSSLRQSPAAVRPILVLRDQARGREDAASWDRSIIAAAPASGLLSGELARPKLRGWFYFMIIFP